MNAYSNDEIFQFDGIYKASRMYLADAAELGRFDAGRLRILEREWQVMLGGAPANDQVFSFASAKQSFSGGNGKLTFIYSPSLKCFVLLSFKLKPSARGCGNVVSIEAGLNRRLMRLIADQPSLTIRTVGASSPLNIQDKGEDADQFDARRHCVDKQTLTHASIDARLQWALSQRAEGKELKPRAARRIRRKISACNEWSGGALGRPSSREHRLEVKLKLVCAFALTITLLSAAYAFSAGQVGAIVVSGAVTLAAFAFIAGLLTAGMLPSKAFKRSLNPPFAWEKHPQTLSNAKGHTDAPLN